jgi:type VI secretion system protein ImpC
MTTGSDLQCQDGDGVLDELLKAPVNIQAVPLAAEVGKRPTEQPDSAGDIDRAAAVIGLLQRCSDRAKLLRDDLRFRDLLRAFEMPGEQFSETVMCLALAARECRGSVLRGSAQLIDGIDRLISKQLNLIMHAERFQGAEGAWRGLHSLVFNSPTHADVVIKMLSISKGELNEVFEDYTGADIQNSPIFKRINDPFDVAGVSPFAAIIGDYYFDNGQVDLRVIKAMGAICHRAQAPFVAAADPQLLKLKSWNQIDEEVGLAERLDAKGYEEFNTFRRSEDSRFVALTMPRILARCRYGPDKEPVPGRAFVFHEEAGGGDSSQYVWQNASYAFGTRLIDSFVDCGLGINIQGVEGGGAVTDLPMDTFLNEDGSLEVKCPTEVLLGARAERELSESCGLLPLSSYQGQSFADFFSSRSMYVPPVFPGDVQATMTARAGASLKDTLFVCRFTHYIRKMVAWIGCPLEQDRLRAICLSWLNSYVHPNPNDALWSEVRDRPLSAVELLITPLPGHPGGYRIVMALCPHPPLDGFPRRLEFVVGVN